MDLVLFGDFKVFWFSAVLKFMNNLMEKMNCSSYFGVFDNLLMWGEMNGLLLNSCL
jgi:hypothetical protein